MKSSSILSKLTKNCKKATKVLSLLSILSLQTAFAQEETANSTASDKSLTFSGSVDTLQEEAVIYLVWAKQQCQLLQK
jgi:hypothetical protein